VVPTNTPVVPTNTPVVPTNTPVVPTNTPVVPTNTPRPPTNTPVVPTNTPVVPTNTPVVPTNTPVVPTNTPTTTPTAVLADLSISKSGPATASVGSNVTYTLLVTNNGPATANGVTVVDTLTAPGGATLVSATSTQGSCSGSAPITCAIGTLNAGSNATITVIVNATGAGTITNTGAVSSSTSDPNTANNSSGVTTTVSTVNVDLSVTKTGPGSAVTIGSNVTYQVRVTNNSGTTSATNVQLVDTFSGVAATLVSATPTQGSCTGTGPITCNLGTLAPGGMVDIAVVLQPTATGTLTNQVNVSGSESDPNTANNTATVNTSIVPAALTITKQPSTANTTNNQPVVFTIRIENTTGVNVNVTAVTEDFGASSPAVFEAASCSVTPNSGTCVVAPIQPGFVDWTGNVTLTPGQSLEIAITAVVTLGAAPPGQYCNPSYSVTYSVDGGPSTTTTRTGTACVTIS
ncbi:MAG TPA: DUF11 domain-containing protein, partial [Roseiflexaceae bacterium]|nr:DUF11 domain-containing protein [Roseiflexaceae bacterium]